MGRVRLLTGAEWVPRGRGVGHGWGEAGVPLPPQKIQELRTAKCGCTGNTSCQHNNAFLVFVHQSKHRLRNFSASVPQRVLGACHSAGTRGICMLRALTMTRRKVATGLKIPSHNLAHLAKADSSSFVQPFYKICCQFDKWVGGEAG